MSPRACYLAVAVFGSFLPGCGTFIHQFSLDKFSEPAGAHVAYGGVAQDVRLLRELPEQPVPHRVGLGTMFTLDVPLSAAADTILLPRWAISRAMGHTLDDRPDEHGAFPDFKAP